MLDLFSRTVLVGFFLSCLLLTMGLYGKAVRYPFVLLDDDVLVKYNTTAHGITPAHITAAFTHFDPELYIPLTFLSYQFDYMIGGGSPAIFHLTNLVLHAFNAFLVGLLLALLLRNRWLGIACGLLFIVHPLHTETALWISARKDLLSTALFLCSVLTYMTYRSSELRKWLWLSIVFFSLALLSKVTVLFLPFLLLLIDWHEERTFNKAVLMEKLPYVLLALLFGIIALFGKQENLAHLGMKDFLFLSIKNTFFSLWSFIVPIHLSVLYPYTGSFPILSSDFLIPLSMLLILSGIVVRLRKARSVPFGALFFFLALSPSFLTYAKAGDVYFASDRYVYIPSIGLLFLLGLGLKHFLQTHGSLVAVLLLLAGCIVLSRKQADVWASSNALFNNVLRSYDNAQLAHEKMGALLINEGNDALGFAELQRSIRIRPTARAYYNLGILSLKQGNFHEAKKNNEKAIQLDPHYALAHANLAYLLWQEGNVTGAITEYEKAIALDPDDPDTLVNVGALYFSQGQREAARAAAERALRSDPRSEQAKMLLEKTD